MIAGALTAIGAAVLSACAPMCTAPAQLEQCAGDVITVRGDEPTGCDVTPPQTITVIGVDRLECDDIGGTFSAPDTCERVDY